MSTETKGLGKGKQGLSGARRPRKVLRDNIQGLTKPVIKRLAHRAGITRLGGLIYQEVRGIIKVKLTELIKNMVTFALAEKMSTIKMRHLEGALAIENKYLGAGVSKTINPALKACPTGIRKPKKKGEKLEPKKRRSKPRVAAIRDVKRQQKNSDCLAFPKLSFSRVVREILQDFDSPRKNNEWDIGEPVVLMIQLFIESYITDLLKDAHTIALNADRVTVMSKDLHAARRVRSENV